MSDGCSGVDPVPSLILRHAETRSGHTALLYPRGKEYGRLGYGELAERVASAANALANLGVGRGDRVSVLVPMSADLYVVLLAIVSLGAVAVFVEPASTPREIARVARVTRPKAFVGIAKAHALRALFRDIARAPVQILVGSPAMARALGAHALSDLEAAERGSALPALEVSPDEPALLTFSSGSTGTPKGATRSHSFLAAQHAAIERLLARPAGVEDIHMSAFAIVLLSALASGMTAVIPPLGRGGVSDVSGTALVEAIDRYAITAISGSPAFLAPIFEAAARRDRALASVRRVVSGGAPVPISLCETADERLLPNGTFLVVYGSTEAEPIATIEASEVRRETAAATRDGAGLCVGVSDPHVEVRLLKPETRPLSIGPGGMDALCVAAGEVGEIAVAGDHVNRHYYRNKPAELATKIAAGGGEIWHRTGDAGYFDDRGRLWLVGRVADIVRRGDALYHPAAVEALAQGVAFVDRAALIEDGKGGTLLVVQPRRPWSAAERLQFFRLTRRARASQIRDRLERAGVIADQIRFVSRLPVDPRHRAKLDYPAIRRRFQ